MYRPLTSSIPTKLRHVYVPPTGRGGERGVRGSGKGLGGEEEGEGRAAVPY